MEWRTLQHDKPLWTSQPAAIWVLELRHVVEYVLDSANSAFRLYKKAMGFPLRAILSCFFVGLALSVTAKWEGVGVCWGLEWRSTKAVIAQFWGSSPMKTPHDIPIWLYIYIIMISHLYNPWTHEYSMNTPWIIHIPMRFSYMFHSQSMKIIHEWSINLLYTHHSPSYFPGWWFGKFLFFHTLGMSSSQLTTIFQRGRYTTNQVYIIISVITITHYHY